MAIDPSEELLERLASDAVTADDVREYLRTQLGEAQIGYFDEVIDLFFCDQDLENWKVAKAWWPNAELHKVPAQLVCPTLFQLCYGFQEGSQDFDTFAKRLLLRYHDVFKWLAGQGIDTQNPNDINPDRKARQNAEAQRRYRARKAGKVGADHAEARAMAYQAYLAVCAERKAVVDAWAAKVEEARAKWKSFTHENGQE